MSVKSRVAATRMASDESEPKSSPAGGDEEPKTAILATFVAVTINTVLMFIYVGYMPAIYSAHGIDNLTYGYIQSFFAFIQLCSTPLLGRLADIIGPRQVLLMSMLSCTLAHFTLAIASSPSMLIMSRAVSTIMDAGPACQMLLMQLVPESARSRYLSRSALPIAIGMIIGPVIGGTLAARLGPQKPLLMGTTLGFGAISIALTLIPYHTQKNIAKEEKAMSILTIINDTNYFVPPLTTDHVEEETKGWSHYTRLVTKWPTPILLAQRLFTVLPAMTFMMNFGIAGLTYFKLDPQANGLMVSCFGIMMMFNNAVLIPYITGKYNEDALLKVAPLVSVFTYFFMSQANSALQLVFLMFPLSLGFGVSDNLSTVKLTKTVDASDTSMILGIAQMIFHLARTLAPSVGGVLLQYYGWPSIGSFGLAISILSATLAVLYQ